MITCLTADTIFVKCTLGHPWKYIDHWIHSVFLIGLHVTNHVQTKCHKFTIEESIHEKHLTCKFHFDVTISIQFRFLFCLMVGRSPYVRWLSNQCYCSYCDCYGCHYTSFVYVAQTIDCSALSHTQFANKTSKMNKHRLRTM